KSWRLSQLPGHYPHWQGIAVTVVPVFAALVLLGLWRFRRMAVHPLWRLSSLTLMLMSGVLLAQRVVAPQASHFRITVLDVGQGLSAVVRTARHVLVFDTGPKYPSGFNTGSAVLLPYLQSQGIRKVDRLVLSHSDIDHVGGTQDLLRGIRVMDILAGEPPGLGGVAAFRRCSKDEIWWWDGVRFEFLYPSAYRFEEGNNASCVLKVSVDGQAVLLTGDIEQPAEQWLVQHVRESLRSQVVVAAPVLPPRLSFGRLRPNMCCFPRERTIAGDFRERKWLPGGLPVARRP
ncbi:MBL fold metallo-hydrolase, partial [Thiolapillus sp.]